MFGCIVVPTDGSRAAEAALSHALSLVGDSDATVHLLYVADLGRDSVSVVGSDVVDALVSDGEDVVETVAERVRTAGLDVETEVVRANPAVGIVDYAEEIDADLIVMGTHGRRGLSRYLLGSVTERVVRTSSVPVLVLRADEE